MIESMRGQGITEVILAVQYLADRFRSSLGDGSRLGVRVHIAEPEPRGTAGAVKNVEHMLDDTTFVFNGDVMTDLDVRAIAAYHRQQASKLTIALTPVEDPTAFGLVETEAGGRIRFLEKPRPEDVTTNMINAGTYILEPEVFRYVPADQFYMFERGLFPTMLRQGEPMFGFPSRSYTGPTWASRRRTSRCIDILIGKVRYAFRGKPDRRARLGRGRRADRPDRADRGAGGAGAECDDRGRRAGDRAVGDRRGLRDRARRDGGGLGAVGQ